MPAPQKAVCGPMKSSVGAAAALEALREAHIDGARVVSIRSGVFALAESGLLDGLTATTHWRAVDRLARLHPAVLIDPDVLYIDHGHRHQPNRLPPDLQPPLRACRVAVDDAATSPP